MDIKTGKISSNTAQHYLQTFCDLFIAIDDEGASPLPVGFFELALHETFNAIHGYRFTPSLTSNSLSRALANVKIYSKSGAGPSKFRVDRFGSSQSKIILNARPYSYAELRASRPDITFELPKENNLHRVDPMSDAFALELGEWPSIIDWKPAIQSRRILEKRKASLQFLYTKYLTENPEKPNNPKTYTEFLDRERIYPYIDHLHRKGVLPVSPSLLPKG